MKGLIVTPLADADLIAIYDYTADRWGLAQADRYLGEIHSRIAGEIAAHLYVPHGRGGVVHGAPLHGLSPRAMRAPAERIGLVVHVHVRRHAGRRACQCDEGYFSLRTGHLVTL